MLASLPAFHIAEAIGTGPDIPTDEGVQTFERFSPSTMVISGGTYSAGVAWSRMSPRTCETPSNSFKKPCEALTPVSWRWPARRRCMRRRHQSPWQPHRLDLCEDSMSSPANIVDLGNGYAVHWPDQNIRILLEYLTKERNGVIGEITILDGALPLCESLRINLNAEPKTKSIAKKVHENDGRLTLPDWARMIESTCVLTLRRYRRGEPSRYLDRHIVVEPLTFALNPLVPKKKACILFSDGGKGKSTLALSLALAVNAGAAIAGVSALKGKALYLDWEDDVDMHARRLQAIQAGHPELIDAGVEYLRCTEPLSKQTYQLVKLIQEKAITFIVIDSLMAATGGDASAEATGHLFAAIRQFNVESLCIGHVPKTKGEGQEHSTVYGSIFNQNYARAVWELQTEQEIGDEAAILGLFHRKSNLSRKHAPIGLKVTHNAQGTFVRYEAFDLSKTADLQHALPLQNRIRNLLDSDGMPRTSQQVADELDAKLGSVKTTLSSPRYKGFKWSMLGEGKETKWTTIIR